MRQDKRASCRVRASLAHFTAGNRGMQSPSLSSTLAIFDPLSRWTGLVADSLATASKLVFEAAADLLMPAHTTCPTAEHDFQHVPERPRYPKNTARRAESLDRPGLAIHRKWPKSSREG